MHFMDVRVARLVRKPVRVSFMIDRLKVGVIFVGWCQLCEKMTCLSMPVVKCVCAMLCTCLL